MIFENIRKKIARWIIRFSYVAPSKDVIKFDKVITNSHNFFIILPAEDSDLQNCLDVINYLRIHKKNLTLFVNDIKSELIPGKGNYLFVSYSDKSKNILFLPDHTLRKRIEALNYDVIIDLNLKDDVFSEAIVSLVSSKIKIGFFRKGVEKPYNFLIKNSNLNSTESYLGLVKQLYFF